MNSILQNHSEWSSKTHTQAQGRCFLWSPALLCAAAALAVWTSVHASPFRDLRVPFTQPDGTKIVITGSGDEFYAVFETDAGFTVIFDAALKAYCYAALDAEGRLVSTGRQVHLADPVALGLQKHWRMWADARRQQTLARRQRRESGMQAESRWQEIKTARRLDEANLKDGIETAPRPPPKKEDEILYPWMDRSLSVKEVGELFSKFNEVDEISGNGVTERSKTFVVRVEEKIKNPRKEVRP